MPAPRFLPTALATAAFLALGATNAQASQPVKQADSFVDSIGVNVHMTYRDTVYRNRDLLVDKLRAAGIRNMRDGLVRDTQYAWDSFNRAAAMGIKTTFIMGDPTERTGTQDQLLAALRTKVPNAAAAVEGPNEYAGSGRPAWASELRDYQRRLFSRIKGDPAFSHLPVLAPSLVTWQDHAAVGDLTDALDAGNKHPYPGGDIPEGNMDNEFSVASRVSGSRAMYVTESGYNNAVNTTSGHRPASEVATATYLPRMFLEYFRRGVPRTFTYELIDTWADSAKRNVEANFGLLRNDYSEKPAYRSLANLISVLNDRGSQFTPSALDYSVAGAPSDLRQLVLQKRDGSHFLVLWRAVRVWDPVARTEVVPAARTVSVSLPGEHRDVDRIDPISSVDPTSRYRSSSRIDVPLRGEPVILHVAAAERSAAGAPDESTAAPAPPAAPTPVPAVPVAPARPPAGTPPAPAPAVPAPAVPVPLNPWVAPDAIDVPGRQRARDVLKRGVEVRCVSARRATCQATLNGPKAHQRARTSTLLKPRRRVVMRVRLSKSVLSFVRRALRTRRSVALTVHTRLGSGPSVARRVVLFR